MTFTRSAALVVLLGAAVPGAATAWAQNRDELSESDLRFLGAGPALHWNAIARWLITAGGPPPATAFYVGNNNSRLYALVSGAQYEAARRAGPDRRRQSAAAAGAAALVLEAVFPNQRGAIERELLAERRRFGDTASTGSMTLAETRGRRAARRWLALVAGEMKARAWRDTIPTGPGYWASAGGQPPGLATAALYRPWFLRSARQLRPPPPPAFGSPAFEAALDEVRRATRERTRQQTKATWAWALNAATVWNEIAGRMILEHRLSEREAARVIMYLNMALSDATIACWDAKLHYWSIRPSQADSTIELSISLPPFPAYPSAHAALAAAAAAVIGHLIPTERATLDSIANEVTMSRLWAGVHYRFDNEAGTAIGRAVGRMAVAAMRREERSGRHRR